MVATALDQNAGQSGIGRRVRVVEAVADHERAVAAPPRAARRLQPVQVPDQVVALDAAVGGLGATNTK